MKSWTADASIPLSWIVIPIGLITAAQLGFSSPGSPVLVLVAAAVSGVVVVSTLGHRTAGVLLHVLGALLLGYMLQGRGFAYFGIPPLYIGEVVLAFSLIALPFVGVKWRYSPLELLLIAFMLLGLLRTVPYFATDGLDAVRDAAVWYYGMFGLLASHLLDKEKLLNRVVHMYARLLGAMLAWILIMSMFFPLFVDSLPHFPGSPLPIISVVSPGGRAVVLAGIAAFLMSGVASQVMVVRRIPIIVLWAMWILCALLVAIEGRGGLLALIVAALLVLAIQPSREWFGEGMKIAYLATAGLVLLLVIDFNIDLGTHRTISVEQLSVNVMSIFSNETADIGSVQGTKDWRLNFWTDIYNNTVQGPLFWTGDGFGANLVSKYGYIIDAEEAVRAPHSIHFTILGRMGVPGALLWIALQGGFLVGMLRAIRLARHLGNTYLSGVLIWLLAMWAAALVTGSFDPSLEGPHGAIPFWCVFGAGIATMRIQRQTAIPTAQPAERKEELHADLMRT